MVNIDERQRLSDLPTARALLLGAARRLPAEEVPLADAAGRVLAEDVVAPHDLPRWSNSSLDGYALRAADAGDRSRSPSARRAGDDPPPLPPGAAAGIATGGVLPEGADAILPVERATERDGAVLAEGPVAAGDGVRPEGADVRAGAAVLAAGTPLTPLAVAAIAGLGLPAVRVTRRPRAVVLTTGDELVPPGGELRRGQIHESNSFLIAATLRRLRLRGRRPARRRRGHPRGDHDGVRGRARRRPRRELGRRLRRAARPGAPGARRPRRAGALLARRAAARQAVLRRRQQRRRGRARPARATRCPCSSACTCWCGRSSARCWAGPRSPSGHAALGDAVRRLPTRTRALPMRLDGMTLRPLGADLSHQLARAAAADALAVIAIGEGELPAGEVVPYVPLR